MFSAGGTVEAIGTPKFLILLNYHRFILGHWPLQLVCPSAVPDVVTIFLKKSANFLEVIHSIRACVRN